MVKEIIWHFINKEWIYYSSSGNQNNDCDCQVLCNVVDYEINTGEGIFYLGHYIYYIPYLR